LPDDHSDLAEFALLATVTRENFTRRCDSADRSAITLIAGLRSRSVPRHRLEGS
jgi:hypothetical protein